METIFKCKMCGGTLSIVPGSSVCECEYCGTKQTLPKFSDEKKSVIYDRASNFRRNNDYDKAAALYEQLIVEDNTQSDVYWSMVLCHYGIEYVDDPSTGKKIPTANRTQSGSIYDDYDYKKALENADEDQKLIYESEAKIIDKIQKEIVAISLNEDPYDIFICYKESDERGRRTEDSSIAQYLYNSLTKEGYRVFFSRISLEDKIGRNYEPYIFAALNSAKIMLMICTKKEYADSVWVRNEWSRFLSLSKNNSGKYLIPVYKNMNVYDLPKELSALQAQDASKIGYDQDIIHGINKLLRPKENITVIKEVSVEVPKKKINFGRYVLPILLAITVIFGVVFFIKNRVTIQKDIKNAAVGSIVKFGSYDQDNNSLNGKEKIEWIILEKENNSALLLSRYVLDCQSYSNDNTYVSWEDSSLNKWLINDFYNEAFSSKEKNILRENVTLLNTEQIKNYLPGVTERAAVGTKKALANGLPVSSTYGNCEWWALPSSSISKYVAKVKENGSISSKADSVISGAGVRPAIVVYYE